MLEIGPVKVLFEQRARIGAHGAEAENGKEEWTTIFEALVPLTVKKGS